MKKVDAVIVIADIEESSEYAYRDKLTDYNRMVREYHQVAFDAVRRYQEEKNLNKQNIEGAARGDEVLLIIHGLGEKRNALHAIKLALHLREAWLDSKFNHMRINEGKDFTHVRVGIGEGKLAFENNCWTGTVTPEGFAISQAKRIESVAGPAPVKILVKSTMRTIIEQGMPNLTISKDCTLKLKGVGDVTLFQVEQYKGWLEAIKKEQAKKEEKFFFFSKKGYLAAMAGNNVECEKAFRKLIRLKPGFHLSHFSLGWALANQGKHEEALKEFREAIRLKPDLPQAHYGLGLMLGNLGNREEGAKEYREATRLKPDYINAHYNLAFNLRESGALEEAIGEYHEVIRLNPDDAEAHYNLGVAFKRLGNPEVTVSEFKEAIRLKPDYVPAHVSLGAMLKDQGNLEGAIAEFEAAAQFNLSCDFIYYILACTYALSNKKKDAIKSLSQAIVGGFDDWPSMEKNEDLNCLRDDPRFKELAEKVKTRWEKKQKEKEKEKRAD